MENIDWDFVRQHANESVKALALRFGAARRADIVQIQCRQKCATKLRSTLARAPQFVFPNALAAEQATHDDIARWHASLISPEATVYDLTAGLGIDALALAQQAQHVTAIDLQPEVAAELTHNASLLGRDNLTAICADCREFLATAAEADVAFIDPARRGQQGERLYSLSQCQPNVVEMLTAIASKCRTLIVKASPMLDLTQTLRELRGCRAIAAVETHGECKEVLAIVDTATSHEAPTPPTIMAVRIQGEAVETFTFTHTDEATAEAQIWDGDIATAKYLYEPGPAMMKAAPLRLLSARYGLQKLHRDTHIYVSTAPVDVPLTRRYAVVDATPLTAANMRALKKAALRGDVATRNYHLSAAQLQKRLNIAPHPTDAIRLLAANTASQPMLFTLKK